MLKIRFELIEQIGKAQEYWQKLSPLQYPYDEWDFRYAFYQPAAYKLAFYAGYLGEELVGLLPLQFNQQKNIWEFFGGNFMEYNHVLAKNGQQNLSSKFYRHVFSHLKGKIHLRDFFDGSPDLPNYSAYDKTYFLSLSDYQGLDDFWQQKFSSKSRSNLRKKIRQVEQHEIKMLKGGPDDLELLFEYNIKRFGIESSFARPEQREAFRNLLKLPWNWFLRVFIVDGAKEAVSLSLQYKNTYLYIMAGSNIEKVPNIGTYVIVKELEKAWQTNATFFDAGRNNSGWKERWHLNSRAVYRATK